MGNGEAKNLIRTSHGHELRGGQRLEGGGVKGGADKGEKKVGQL